MIAKNVLSVIKKEKDFSTDWVTMPTNLTITSKAP